VQRKAALGRHILVAAEQGNHRQQDTLHVDLDAL
jgi:hypothetical protein